MGTARVVEREWPSYNNDCGGKGRVKGGGGGEGDGGGKSGGYESIFDRNA